VLKCSADLKKVLNEQGQIVETCDPEEGCFDGACIAACEAGRERARVDRLRLLGADAAVRL
jgi:hypothetical protein